MRSERNEMERYINSNCPDYTQDKGNEPKGNNGKGSTEECFLSVATKSEVARWLG